MTFSEHLPTSSAESPVDEISSCLEVDAHVKVTGVMSLYAQVGDLHALIDIWLSSVFTVSCIQDVSDSMHVQFGPVLSTVSEKYNASVFPDEPFTNR